MTDGDTRVRTKGSRIRLPGSGVTMSVSVESNGEHTASTGFARLGQGARRMSRRVCLITGTDGSMGRATALGFAREGASVVGCDVTVEPAWSTVETVRRAGGEMVSMQPWRLDDPADCQGGARPRLKRTQHGAGLRHPCRRVGRFGLRLDAPRTAVREDVSERLSRSRPAPENLPACATRSRPQVARIEPPAAGATIGP
jgi:hypothetical protein